MTRKVFLCSATGLLALAVACGKTSPVPTSPSSATPGTTSSATDGFLLKAGTPGVISPTDGAQVDDPVFLTASTTAGTYVTLALSYRFQVRSGSTVVTEGVVGPISSGSTVTFNPVGLALNTDFTWRVQATYQGNNAPWSADASFKTIGKFKSGQNVNDPLLDGTTVGVPHGGHFVIGQGWQADSYSDGLDYDIPTCNSCRVEFDVTNFGKGLGNPGDLKWLSMANADSFGGFGVFRDTPWKMHLEERGDGDGTGMKLIWRNGGNGGGDPGDHTQRIDHTVDWQGGSVYHFIFDWTPGGYLIAVNGQIWFQGSFNGAYAPPNHRISLGCYPRSETQKGAIWRNVSIKPH